MAYFQRKTQEDSYTRQFDTSGMAREEDWEEDYGDDGFDELMEEELDEVPSEEVTRREKMHKYRVAAGFGDFGATLVGVLLILVLVAFLISMVKFVTTDFSQNFSLWQTRF